MFKIVFKEGTLFDRDSDIYISSSEMDNYYEADYLENNPDMHLSDVKSKIEKINKVLNLLKIEYNFCPKKVLDIGSGSTLILKGILEKLGNDTVGLAVDISKTILERSPKFKNITKLKSDAKELPLNDNSFDVVLLIDLLEHTKDPELIVKESLRVGEFVIIKIPLELSLYTMFRGGKKRLKKMEDKYGHIQHYNRNQVSRLYSNYNVVCESYMKIPNRPLITDLLQEFMLKLRFFRLFRVVFGGFLIICIKK